MASKPRFNLTGIDPESIEEFLKQSLQRMEEEIHLLRTGIRYRQNGREMLLVFGGPMAGAKERYTAALQKTLERLSRPISPTRINLLNPKIIVRRQVRTLLF